MCPVAELVFVSGNRQGQRIAVSTPRIVIGRHPACDVVLDISSVSRQHAALIVEGDDVFVEDLRSRNGTTVNGSRLTSRHRLADGDELVICDQCIRFQDAEHSDATILSTGPRTDEADMVEAEIGDSHIVSQVDMRGLSGDVAGRPQSEAQLRAVVGLRRALGGSLSLDEVLPRMLDGLFGIFTQADRGFALLIDPKSQRLVLRASRFKDGPEAGPLRLSLSLLDNVVKTKRAILSADAVSDSRFDSSHSIVDCQIRSVMCVPVMRSDGDVLGVVHVDSRDPRSRFEQADLEVLAGIAGDAAQVIEQAVAHDERIGQEQLKRDLELAHRVQQGLLPTRPPAIPGYEVFDFYEPAQQVGGDFFAYVPLAGGALATVMADVCGKGVSAALMMASLSGDVRYCLASEPDASVAVARINEAFLRSGWDDRFATLIAAVLEPQSGRVTLVNAGHLPALIRDARGTVREVGAEESGLPLGVDAGAAYVSCSDTLRPGETLILFTDGITEAMDHEHRCYGTERLTRVLEGEVNAVEDLGRRILADVDRHAAGQLRSDDICLICLRRSADGAVEFS
jgi:sigma-B regulation protein RsbU (phosphoserine phosphatase)